MDSHEPPASGERRSSVLETRLNPKYTFETFVIGSSNRFPHAAAVAVAEAPGKAYNPLLVYGDSGLGKTHLLHAIGHYVRSLYTGAKVRYVSSEEFTNEFINAIRDDRQDRFKRRYRDVDVLLIDDIQFLEGKTQTQEEFFHTFNTLHNANKQIVLTSDRPPKRLEALEDRLRNRFEWGLITDVQPPDLETRIAILRKKAAMDRLTAPPDVLEFIASKIQTNIRELEGALIRVTAFANLNRQQVDLALAEIVDALRRFAVPIGEMRRHVLHHPAQQRWRGQWRRLRRDGRHGTERREPRRHEDRDRPRQAARGCAGAAAGQSPSTHSTLAPRRVMFSANCGWARRTGVALRITDLPGMLAATISSAMATRMM